MRAECPGCKQIIALTSEEILKAKRTVEMVCPACHGVLTLGIVESRLAVVAPPEPQPAAAPSPAAEAPREPAAEPADDQTVVPGLKSHILRSLVNLPAMPMVILKAREVMADPNSGLRDLAKIIENDQAVVGRVLSMANSAFYGLSGQVSSIRHASVLLGLRVLGDIIVMSAAASLLNRELKGYGLSPQAAWRHSLAAALCARRIAEQRHPELSEDAFVVGLLHDGGKIILEPFVEKTRAALLELSPAGGLISAAAEKETLGFDHTEIIARACRFWRFPEAVVQGVRHHHAPSQSSESLLAYMAHCADFAAHRAAEAPVPGDLDQLRAEGTLDRLQLTEGDLEALAAATSGEVQKMESGLQGS